MCFMKIKTKLGEKKAALKKKGTSTKDNQENECRICFIPAVAHGLCIDCLDLHI